MQRLVVQYKTCIYLTLFALVFLIMPNFVKAALQAPDFLKDYFPRQQSPQISIDNFSGAFIYNYPLVIPPGRNGIEPSLSINYNNQDTDNSNLFGYGWSIDIPFIERINRLGVGTVFTDTYFYSALSGELASTSVTTYGSKVDNGEFLEYSFNNNIWSAVDKEGNTYKFGYSSSTVQDNPDDDSQIFKWMIEEMHDSNGNTIKYEYYKDSGQIYPSKIKYTGNGVDDGIFEIEFLRESRNDIVTSTKEGFAVVTKERIGEIQVKVNGSWIRKYELEYTSGENGVRSLLSSITETGKDEQSNTIILPSTDFAYETGDKGWTEDLNYTTSTLPEIHYDNDGDKGVHIMDVNGDGYSDIVQSYQHPGGTTKGVYINSGDGSGWTLDSGYTIPIIFFHINDGERGVRVLDINGDGLSDLVQSISNAGQPQGIYLNKGDGTGWNTDTASPNFPIFFEVQGDGAGDQGVRVMEVNGDGLPDLVQSFQKTSDASSKEKHIWINTGQSTAAEAWAEDLNYTTSTLPEFQHGVDGDQGVRIVDVNGDSLDDIVQSYDSGGNISKHVWINSGDGTGWVEDFNYNISIIFTHRNYGSYAVRFADINGDGLLDLTRSISNAQPSSLPQVVYINDGDGTGWTQDTSYPNPNSFPIYWETQGSLGDRGVRFLDADGNVLVDFIQLLEESDNNREKHIWINDGNTVDGLINISFKEGGFTKIVYKYAAEYLDGSDNLLNPKLSLPLQTVHQLVRNDGFGTVATTTYEYSDGEFYYNNEYDRKFAGFGKVEKEDPDGNVTKTYYHQGNNTDSAKGEYSDHISKMGKPYREEIYDNADNLYKQNVNKWERYDLGNDRNFAKLTQTIDYSYDGDSEHKDKVETYTYNNTNGNLTQQIEWGEVTGADNGTFTDIGTDKFTTDISYISTSTIYLAGLPIGETVEDQSLNKVKESKFYYDNLSFGSAEKGNETKRELWEKEEDYIDIEKTYNSFGLVIQEKDPRDKVTSYSYDSENLYVTTSTNALSQPTYFTYDYSSGKVKTIIDLNGFVFETVYDALDRIKEEKQPDIDTPSTLVAKTSYVYTDTKGAKSIEQTNYLDSSTTFDVYTYLDGFDRVIQERREVEDANNFSVKDFIYNKRGLIEKQSLPYFSTGSARTSATTDSDLLTVFTYDPLNRIIQQTTVVGDTIRAYNDWKETITDTENNDKHLYRDVTWTPNLRHSVEV